jgi:hypothetical protein
MGLRNDVDWCVLDTPPSHNSCPNPPVVKWHFNEWKTPADLGDRSRYFGVTMKGDWGAVS